MKYVSTTEIGTASFSDDLVSPVDSRRRLVPFPGEHDVAPLVREGRSAQSSYYRAAFLRMWGTAATLVAWLVAWNRMRLTHHQLRKMDSHMLQDIGLDPAALRNGTFTVADCGKACHHGSRTG